MRHDKEKENFEILIRISKENHSQRKIAIAAGFSLGKVNYCLKELHKKGLVKIQNFKNNKNKVNYLYYLTPKGIAKKTQLALKFMQRKMQEYDELKKIVNEKKNNKKN